MQVKQPYQFLALNRSLTFHKPLRVSRFPKVPIRRYVREGKKLGLRLHQPHVVEVVHGPARGPSPDATLCILRPLGAP